MEPLVSVVIPTRDRPDMLRDAIASVRAQTFTDCEIIVVINGPDNPLTQDVWAVAAEGGASVVRIERAGIAVALNAGANAARGQWIAFLDDDDLWEPNKLATELKVAAAVAADVLFSDFSIIDQNGARVRAPPVRPPPAQSVREAMTIRNYGYGCSSTTVRRAALLAVGGFDETLVSPDWDLWMRLAWRYRVAWTDAYLVFVRHHGQNTSKQISWAYWTLRIARKSLKTLPPELRHLRPQILLRMMQVALKGAETYIRHNYIVPLRQRLRGK
jgi:glycosyltransferase involved in cell wall biosynthesis